MRAICSPANVPSDYGHDTGVRPEVIQPMGHVRSIEDCEIRGLADLERAYLVFQADRACGIDGSTLERFGRSHALERDSQRECQGLK